MNDIDLGTLVGRVTRCRDLARALRAWRHCCEWPTGHPDAPRMPAHVAAFENAHGPLPASAERIMREFQPEGE